MAHSQLPAGSDFPAVLARRDEHALLREAKKMRQPQRLHHLIRVCLAEQWWRGADRLWAHLETSQENAVRAALLAVLDRRGVAREQTAVLDWAVEKMHGVSRPARKHMMQEAILQAALHTGQQTCWQRTLRLMGRLNGPFDTFDILAKRGADPVATWVYAHAHEGGLDRTQAGAQLTVYRQGHTCLRAIESVSDLHIEACPGLPALVLPWAQQAVDELLQAGAHPTTEQVLQAGINARTHLLQRYLAVEAPEYTLADLAGLACGLGTAAHLPTGMRPWMMARMVAWGVSDIVRLPARKPCRMWTFDQPARSSYRKEKPSLIVTLRMPQEAAFNAETCCVEALTKPEGSEELQVDVALWWSQGAKLKAPLNNNAQASECAAFRSMTRARCLEHAWTEVLVGPTTAMRSRL